MRTVTFKGGPAEGLDATIDRRDVIAVIRAAVLPDPHRVVVLTATISNDDLNAAHERWVEYYRWPALGDDQDVAEYRVEQPPVYARGFSASG